MDGPTTEITRTERSGVPVLWAEAPAPCVGALIVRSGKVDETLPLSGINHLVEHLALFPFGRRAYGYNGRVEDAMTVFFAEGAPDEVAGFLAELAGNLAALPVDRLEVERRILMTEAHGREMGVEPRMLALRFGPVGYGLMVQEEFGLGWLDGDRVQGWARERFTTGNAVAWMSAEPPPGLELTLADGEARRPPRPEPIPGLALPAEIAQGTGGVAFTATAPRSAALNAAFAIAAERAHERLRREAGLSYSASASYFPLDAELAHVMLHADCKDHNAGVVRDELLAVLDDLASSGPTEEELEHDREMARRSREEPTAVLGLLDYTAREMLLGGTPRTAQELARERDELTCGDVAEAVATALEQLLVLVPTGTTGRDAERLREYDPSSGPPIEGAVFEPSELRRSLGEDDRLIFSPEGVASVDGTGANQLAVRFADCVAFIPLLSGAATVMDRSGAWLVVSPHLYEDGAEALERVREAVADDVVVPLTDRERELLPAVAEHLGGEVQRVPAEVDALASVLTPDEDVAVLAGASLDGVYGLLALTDRRLVFFAIAADKFLEHARTEARAELKGRFRRKRLVITAGAEQHEIVHVHPASQLDRLASELR